MADYPRKRVHKFKGIKGTSSAITGHAVRFFSDRYRDGEYRRHHVALIIIIGFEEATTAAATKTSH